MFKVNGGKLHVMNVRLLREIMNGGMKMLNIF